MKKVTVGIMSLPDSGFAIIPTVTFFICFLPLRTV